MAEADALIADLQRERDALFAMLDGVEHREQGVALPLEVRDERLGLGHQEARSRPA